MLRANPMTGFRLDCRHAWRSLRRARAFVTVAVLTLALGVATTTTVFALISGTIFRPIGGVQLGGTFRLGVFDRRNIETPMLESEYRELAANRPPGMSTVTAVSANWGTVVARIPGRADELPVQGVSGSMPAFFDLRPERGRWIEPADDRAEGAEAVVVISHRVWHEWLGRSDEVIGTSVQLGPRSFRIIGVAAEDFVGLHGGFMPTDLWVPLAHLPSTLSGNARTHFDRIGYRVAVFVRPQAGVPATVEAAAIGAQLTTLAAGRFVAVELWPTSTLPLTGLDQRRAGLVVVLSLLVLAGACANLANLLYSRHAVRAGDLAVRAALGASRARLVRLAVVEAMMLATAASLAGTALALGATRLMGTMLASATNVINIPLALDATPDWRVLVYGIGAGLGSGLVVAAIAALQSLGPAPWRLLAGSAGTTTGLTPAARRMRTALVAVQVTAAVVLVMGTGVIFERTREATDAGLVVAFDAARVTTGRFNLALDGYDDVRGAALLARVADDARRMPDVEQAAIVDALPGRASPFANARPPRVLLSEDSQRQRTSGSARSAEAFAIAGTPGVFDTLGLRVTRGRAFQPSDGDGAPLVAVLSDSAAEALWPGRDPIGRSVRVGGTDRWTTVVGTVEDPLHGPRDSRVYETSEGIASIRPSNFLFRPFAQHYSPRAFVLVRSDNPEAQIGPLRAVVRNIDESVGLFDVGVASRLLDWLGPIRVVVVLVTTLGAVALAIALLGVYGVVSYFVSTRTREIGVRMALGATPLGVVKLVVDHAVHIMLVGLLPGVFVASVASRLVEANIVRLMPNQISTWVIVPTAILAAGVLAALVPAWRASRVDPSTALRQS